MKRPPTVVTIGTFDGVHLGHAALIRRARGVADTEGGNARVVAMAFDPHPIAILRPAETPPRLTTFERRAELLGLCGADEVVRLEPTGSLLGLSAEEFVAHVVKELSPIAIVEGPDFRFGRRRAGDVALLERLGVANGFVVHIVSPAVEVVMSDHAAVAASSTLARWLIENGRVRDAAAVLGRPYEMTGTVVPGNRRGRTIGYPTANLDSPCLAPADGVYSGAAVLADGRRMAAAISVGTKPMFGGGSRAVEGYLMLDGPERVDGATWRPIDGLPEYGWEMRLEFHHWLRDQARFDSVDALLAQMARDCARAKELGSLTEEAACR